MNATPPLSTLIRDASDADRPGLRDLWAATWQATYAPLVGHDAVLRMIDDVDASQARSMLPGTDERAAVAVLADRIIGSAVAAERGRTAFLWGMYVHPSHQRSGIGTALLRHAASSLATTTTIELGVLCASPGAIGFYTRYGFVETAREDKLIAPQYPAVPGLIMTATRADVLERLSSIVPGARRI